MAIDTANKRRSVSGYTNMPMLPVANAAIDAFDREMVAWLYSGLSAASPSVGAAAVCLTLDPRSLALTLRSRSLRLHLGPRPDC